MYYKTIFFFYVPTMLLLEKTSFDMMLRNLSILIAWLTVLCLFSLFLWKKGMKRYSTYEDKVEEDKRENFFNIIPFTFFKISLLNSYILSLNL